MTENIDPAVLIRIVSTLASRQSGDLATAIAAARGAGYPQDRVVDELMRLVLSQSSAYNFCVLHDAVVMLVNRHYCSEGPLERAYPADAAKKFIYEELDPETFIAASFFEQEEPDSVISLIMGQLMRKLTTHHTRLARDIIERCCAPYFDPDFAAPATIRPT